VLVKDLRRVGSVGLGRRWDLCDRQRLKFNLPQRQTGKNAVKSKGNGNGKEKGKGRQAGRGEESRGKYFEMQAESKQTQRTTDKDTERRQL